MVRPKKHLGQHFLKDQNIASKIVAAIESDGLILEVGPGTGVLTRFLIESNKAFLAYDVDEESIQFLFEKYPEHSDQFLLKDFLREDLPALAEQLVVLGNFPYNISSQLFFKVYENHEVVTEVVCMVQKEVAQRIHSPPGNKTYGILSVLLQAYYEVDYLFTVPPDVFQPPPKVDSAVIRLKRNNVAQLGCDERHFKRVVKEAFGKRRKTLRNALKGLNLPAEITEQPRFDLRAEQLSVEDFISLTNTITSAWKD